MKCGIYEPPSYVAPLQILVFFSSMNFCCSFPTIHFVQGFRKVDPDRWEFANEGFLMGHKHLLKYIRRRKVSSSSASSSSSSSQVVLSQQQNVVPCVEIGQYGTDAETDRLRRVKQNLTMELVELRQQQQNTRIYLQSMEQRIRGTEQKQQRMMTFLARAMQNPAFINQLVKQKEKRNELEEAATRKRRWPIGQGCSQDAQGWNLSLVKAEPREFQEYGFEVSELESLALEMQGYGRGGKAHQEEMERREGVDKELDDEFWEELLTRRSEGELEMPGNEDEDVSLLADKLGYLGSSPK